MPKSEETTYTLHRGESLFIEGKYGIIHIHMMHDKCNVTASDKTDAKRNNG